MLRERETKFQLNARRSFYELLSDAMLHVDKNVPLIRYVSYHPGNLKSIRLTNAFGYLISRILLPYFSHYSDEWLQLMEKYCHLDATADLTIGLKRLERRSRKIVAGTSSCYFDNQKNVHEDDTKPTNCHFVLLFS